MQKTTTLNTACPKCGSNDTQSFSIANKAGTSSGQIVGFGFGLDANSDIGVARGFTSNKTALAKLTEPPRNNGDTETLALVALCIIVCLAALIFGFAAFGVVGGPLFFLLISVGMGFAAKYLYQKRVPKAEAAFKAAVVKWEHSWLCLRCGKSFYVR